MITNRIQNWAIGAFRIVIGFLFLTHGAASLFAFPGEPSGGAVVEFGAWPGWFAAVIQLVGGALVMLGVGTRVAALICSGSMAYAYFVVHQPMGLTPVENSGELAAMFSWGFLLVAAIGPGAFALGRLLRRRSPGRSDARTPAHAAA